MLRRFIFSLFLVWLTLGANIHTAWAIPSEEEILRAAQDHFPVIKQTIEQMNAARAQTQAATGALDTKIVSNNYFVPIGYYTRNYLDVMVEKPVRFANAKVYAGYSYGYNGMFPPQYSTFSTNSGGTPRVGGHVSLLRGFSIDSRRTEIKKAEIGLDKSRVDLQFTTIQVNRDARIAYWHWISAIRNYHIYHDLLVVAETRDSVLRQRAKAGDISEVVVKENLQYLAHRRGQLAAAELNLKQAALDLSLFYRDVDGQPILLEDIASDGLDGLMHARTAAIDSQREAGAFPRFEPTKLQQRPDILSISNELAMNALDVRLANNMFLPKLDLGMDYTKNIGRQDPTNAQHVLTIFLNLEIPIEYNLLRGTARMAQAQQRALTSRYNFLMETVRVEVNKLNETIRLASERMANAQQEMYYANELLKAETYKYHQGGSNLFLINIREEARTHAEENYIFAQLDLIRAQAEYEASTTLYQE